jgi:hypothetical protein
LISSLNAGAVVMVSAFALIVRSPMLGSLAQKEKGIKAPSHQDQLALAGVSIQPDDRLKRLRRYVLARPEVGQGRAVEVEVLGDALLIGATGVTATHPDYLPLLVTVVGSPALILQFSRHLVETLFAFVEAFDRNILNLFVVFASPLRSG